MYWHCLECREAVPIFCKKNQKLYTVSVAKLVLKDREMLKKEANIDVYIPDCYATNAVYRLIYHERNTSVPDIFVNHFFWNFPR